MKLLNTNNISITTKLVTLDNLTKLLPLPEMNKNNYKKETKIANMGCQKTFILDWKF